MAQTTVHVRNIRGASAAVGWTGHRTVTVDRAEQAGGMGLGFNGGELLLLAIGACYTNDLYREAAKQQLTIQSVQVDVDADWSGDPVRAQNVSFSVKVEARASEREILDLITHTNRVAEIHNSLRMGTAVELGKTEAISVR
ncbi:MAG TPA: OsmC family protein [bacterium]|nr:OsmC family protein [bacterium]